MKISPIEKTATFAEHLESVVASPVAVAPGAFTFQLSLHGTALGGMEIDAGGWCGIGAAATTFRPIVDAGEIYYEVVGGAWAGKYLSVSRKGYVGVYKWSNATSWEMRGSRLYSNYAKASLSYYGSSDGHLYAYDGAGYSTLDVTQA